MDSECWPTNGDARLSFDAYFEELKQGGTLDSTGVFTLNVEKLQGKLAQYQLANPREYAQFLVRAANAAQADRISSTFVPQQSRIEIKKLCFRLEHFQNFSFKRPQSPAEEAAHYVAIALSAAAKLGSVKILVGDRGDGFRISSSGKTLDFDESDPEASRIQGTLFEVTGLLQENPANKLVPSARWSEVPHQPQHFELGTNDIFGEVLAVATGSKFRFSGENDFPVQIELDDAEDLLMLFWSKHEPLSQANVRGVHRGIAYPMPNITLPRGFHAVVRADDLKPDLSYGGLVEDELYEAKGKMLRGLVFNVLERVIEAKVDWNTGQLEDIRQKLALYWPRSRVTEPLRKFYKRHFTLMLPRSPKSISRFIPQLECLSPDDLRHCLGQYRSKVSHLRSVSIQSARREMEMEGELRRHLDLVTPDYLHRTALFQFLYDSKLPDIRSLQDLPSVWAAIELIREPQQIGVHTLTELGLEETWKELILFCFLLERGRVKPLHELTTNSRQPVLAFILHLSKRRCSEARSVANARIPEFAAYPTFWESLVLELSLGKIPWKEQIKLLARSSLWRTDVEKRLLHKARVDGLDRQIWESLIFDSSLFWPMIIYYLLSQRRKRESAVPVLLRLYLQSLLGAPGQSASVADLCSSPPKLPLV